MKKNFALVIALAMLVCLLTGCDNSAPQADSADSAPETPAEVPAEPGSVEDTEVRTIRFASGPVGGVNNTIGAGIASLLMEEHPNYTVSAEVTTGGQENIRMVGTGEADFGIAGPDMVYFANTNGREFEGFFDKQDQFRLVCTGWSTVGFVMVPADSPAQTINDLKGMKIGVGSGSVETNFWPMLLEAYGMTVNDVKDVSMSLSDICEALKDNTIDCGVFCTSEKNSSIQELFQSKDMRLISLSEEAANSIVEKHPYQIKNSVHAGIYEGVDEDVLNIGGTSMIFCSVDTPDVVVYNLVKLIFERNDDLAAMQNNASYLNAENCLTSSDIIPVHPGAEMYYKEVGILN